MLNNLKEVCNLTGKEMEMRASFVVNSLYELWGGRNFIYTHNGLTKYIEQTGTFSKDAVETEQRLRLLAEKIGITTEELKLFIQCIHTEVLYALQVISEISEISLQTLTSGKEVDFVKSLQTGLYFMEEIGRLKNEGVTVDTPTISEILERTITCESIPVIELSEAFKSCFNEEVIKEIIKENIKETK